MAIVRDNCNNSQEIHRFSKCGKLMFKPPTHHPSLQPMCHAGGATAAAVCVSSESCRTLPVESIHSLYLACIDSVNACSCACSTPRPRSPSRSADTAARRAPAAVEYAAGGGHGESLPSPFAAAATASAAAASAADRFSGDEIWNGR